MQNRNAYLAVSVDIWMPHFGDEPHLRRVVWIVSREFKLRLEVAPLQKHIFSHKRASHLLHRACHEGLQLSHSIGISHYRQPGLMMLQNRFLEDLKSY